MILSGLLVAFTIVGQTGLPDLERQLLSEDPASLANEARDQGDPARGARIFYRPQLACSRCHLAGDSGNPLGPDLARPVQPLSEVEVVESILVPSKVIRAGYETVTLSTVNGKTTTGLVAENRPDAVVLRDPGQDGRLVIVARDQIEERKDRGPSLMPAGLVNGLGSRQEFLDLVKYVREVSVGGPARALALRPDPSTIAGPILPAYEAEVDHAGLIAALEPANLRTGEAIYLRVCANCHGTRDREGSMPTSPRFASAALKNGSDPYALYRTLTHGFGQMPPQTWMVPRQKYDVIHYLRETYFKPSNPKLYTPADPAYLASLPKGTTRGPEPVRIEPWSTMDYGPSLMATLEVGDRGTNFAYKGVAVRLDPGPGGVSRGRHWAIYDHDTMRLAGAWSGEGFMDWQGINFDGRHEAHPHIAGRVQFASPNGLGWADPETGSFEDPRDPARDGLRYGPLPARLARFRGLYHHGDRSVLSYEVGATPILELAGLEVGGTSPVFTRTLNLGPRPNPLIVQVAHEPAGAALRPAKPGSDVVAFGPDADRADAVANRPVEFDGTTRLRVEGHEALEMTRDDFTIVARIRTRRGGTIFSQAEPEKPWSPGGKALFVRDGRLVFDIGWVGAVASGRRVNDDRWHDVALVFRHQDGLARLFIDGMPEGQKKLKPQADPPAQITQIGFAAADFPVGRSYFEGRIAEVRFYRKALAPEDIAPENPEARWAFEPAKPGPVLDESGHGHRGVVLADPGAAGPTGPLLASVFPKGQGLEWRAVDGKNLRLTIPAGDSPLKLTIRLARAEAPAAVEALAPALARTSGGEDLAPLTRGGPPRWASKVMTVGTRGRDDGPFAVDVLTLPDANPWLCRVRATGFDFDADGRSAWLCTWDGDVWAVEGIDRPEKGLTWRRIASGLFQPLGLKRVDGKVYVLCRDQIALLRDINGDGETDFVECFNSDHQVTESFHEFAMDLQTDSGGNFYYAKGARHGKVAVVPQHGTLLRVSPDGASTDILATGFRAPNGVCVNPDGTFFLTDQEGFWTPKNRINWVKPGRFYGNIWGHHDVTDPSDSAMEPPLVWITNAVDRSPAEVVRVDSPAWGPLNGQLLNLSYGEGKLYVVPHERVGDRMQGGVCPLPIPPLPTGVMRGRFSPADGQLYACGMFAWAGNREQPGGFYRIRATGKPAFLPVGLSARRSGVAITFTEPLDPAIIPHYAVKTWALKRSQSYGSKHIDERPSPIARATLRDEGRTVFLEIPGIAPTWCMEIKYSIKGTGGQPVEGAINNTIHELND